MERRKNEMVKLENDRAGGGLRKSTNNVQEIRQPRVFKESEVIDMENIIYKAHMKYKK